MSLRLVSCWFTLVKSNISFSNCFWNGCIESNLYHQWGLNLFLIVELETQLDSLILRGAALKIKDSWDNSAHFEIFRSVRHRPISKVFRTVFGVVG